MSQQDPDLVQKSSSGIWRSTKVRTLAQGRGMAGEEEVSAGVGLRGKGVTAAVALWSVVGVRVRVALQEMFVAAVKLVGGALRVVQEVGVWLVYL